MAFFLFRLRRFDFVAQVGVDQINKGLMNATVIRGEFGMECGGHEFALAHKGGLFIAMGENFDVGSGLKDARGADEDHFELVAGEFGVREKDGRVDLPSVCVALDDCVEDAETGLGGIADLARQENCTGACAEDWVGLAEILEVVEQVAPFKKFQHGAGFAAGNDQPVKAFEFFTLADLYRDCTGIGEGGGVGGIVALDSQNANAWLWRISVQIGSPC